MQSPPPNFDFPHLSYIQAVWGQGAREGRSCGETRIDWNLFYPCIFMWIFQDTNKKGFELQDTEQSVVRSGHERNRGKYFGVDWGQFEYVPRLSFQCV